MVSRKNFDKIAWTVTAVMLAITILLMNGKSIGLESLNRSTGYETRLFDNSRVHTIDIVMDDWEGFLETATSEVYSPAAVVIDGEAFKNVGIRGKGNTSLSTVAQLDSDRYSFKIEFDQYETGKSYYGLDKLALNNLIQDSTMMKDYLAYTLMKEFGVNTPLCSFVYITVNGEDWGLYLAVEGVEDSFLQRNYGSEAGELYKPDSMGFGGGRGNGRDFDMMAVWKEMFGITDDEDAAGTSSENSGNAGKSPAETPDGNAADMSGATSETRKDTTENAGSAPEGFDPSSMPGGFPQDFDPSSMPGGGFPGDFDPTSMPAGGFPEGFDPTSIPDGFPQPPNGGSFGGERPDGNSRRGGPGGFGGMGSSDIKLQYTDDDPDSYSNIWNNAKTDITSADQARLIESLWKLSANEDIENVVDVEQVIRYFVVHNFVCNGDSYTGGMIHNYYLYEKDGKLAMIPWDYNLAYGTFQSSDASSSVNSPIDAPVSGGSEDRPMLNWIFQSEEYTELYHQYFSEFLETVDILGIIDHAYELIAPYVEKDPTSFYTYEEFEKGVPALRKFCELRIESIKLQLENGETTENMNYVDASSLNLSDMGSMNNGGPQGGRGGGMPGGFGGGRPGGFGGGRPGSMDGTQMPENFGTMTPPAFGNGFPGGPSQETPQTGDKTEDAEASDDSTCKKPDCAEDSPTSVPDGQDQRPEPPSMGSGGMMPPGSGDGSTSRSGFGNGGMTPPGGMPGSGESAESYATLLKTALNWLGVSCVILAAGWIAVKKYHR